MTRLLTAALVALPFPFSKLCRAIRLIRKGRRLCHQIFLCAALTAREINSLIAFWEAIRVNVQNLIFSALRRAPRRLVRHMAGPPIEVDGFVMDSNIQILANLAAKRAAAQNHETPSLAQIREAGNAFDAIALKRRRRVKIRDVELPSIWLKARIYEPKRSAIPIRVFCFSIRAAW